MDELGGVLLDIDGTLIDSNDAHAAAWADALREGGIDVHVSSVRPLIGMGGDKILPAVGVPDPESTSGQTIARRRGEIFRAHYLPSVRPFPGTRALIARIAQDGFRIVVATSAAKDEVDALLRIAEVEDLVDDVTSGDDVEHSKPDPDIVQGAIALAERSAHELVMLGDTPYDVEAATRAGVPILGFRCGGWNDRALQGAAAIYDGPSDLLAKYETSLLSTRNR